MSWPDSLADGLPAPRDDEPESLRRDIADELADHLQCAVDRHLLSDADPLAARSRALQSFGDPRRIARQLWFDALRERIMSQRILLAAVVLMTIACFAAVVLGWKVAEAGRMAIADLVEQNRASAEALQKANDAMLARMEKLAAVPAAPASLEWSDVRVRLIAAEGKPLPDGYTASLMGGLLESGKNIQLAGVVRPDGTIDFGLVRTGQHSLTIQSPFGDRHYQTINALPGKNVEPTIECPAAPPLQADVSVSIDWPEELKDKGYRAVCGFYPLTGGRREAGLSQWTINAPSAVGQVLIVDQTGRLVSLDPALARERPNNLGALFPGQSINLQSADMGPLGLLALPPSAKGPSNGTSGGPAATTADPLPGLRIEAILKPAESKRVTVWTFGFPRSDPARTTRMCGTKYRLVALFMLGPSVDRPTGKLDESPVLITTTWQLSGKVDYAQIRLPSDPLTGTCIGSAKAKEFEAKPDTENVWKIAFPKLTLDRLGWKRESSSK